MQHGLVKTTSAPMGKKNKNKRIDIVYSTNEDFEFNYEDEVEQETLTPEKQNLKVLLDRKARKGKAVTLIQNFIGSESDLKELGKILKQKCGVGGSVKDGAIIIQTENRTKVMTLLEAMGYNYKRVGG